MKAQFNWVKCKILLKDKQVSAKLMSLDSAQSNCSKFNILQNVH